MIDRYALCTLEFFLPIRSAPGLSYLPMIVATVLSFLQPAYSSLLLFHLIICYSITFQYTNSRSNLDYFSQNCHRHHDLTLQWLQAVHTYTRATALTLHNSSTHSSLALHHSRPFKSQSQSLSLPSSGSTFWIRSSCKRSTLRRSVNRSLLTHSDGVLSITM
jgi:hypothetical protein